MARHALHEQFIAMHSNIALDDRALVAIAAHVEVRSVLRDSLALTAHGLDDVLVGSYARRVTIWPGKDVDVFGRLMDKSVKTITPDAAYSLFHEALRKFEAQGRLTPQPRSLKVSFGPERNPSPRFIRAAAEDYGWEQARISRVIENLDRLVFEFSVDVVPAVPWDGHYGIPEVGQDDPSSERQRTGEWLRTDPVQLVDETHERNRDLTIFGTGAFVRTVKTLKQVKAHHLGEVGPSFLNYEFALHEGFVSGDVEGDSWADVTYSALKFLVERLADARPVRDPVLEQPYEPKPSQQEVQDALRILDGLARRARRAVTTDDRCQAAVEWRHILGANLKVTDVFPLPPGCRADGAAMGAAVANAAMGGTAERAFGGR